ncbi:MAG TPA: DUF4169 family protein [Caulobacteraceae bacterium]|nr:DUF4169 family protein [Caulobacteraceae bacterium]
MAEIINLNRARKVKTKVEEKARAAVNRVAHGRTQAEKALERARADKAQRHIDGHKREP